jgi:hypothetical protein
MRRAYGLSIPESLEEVCDPQPNGTYFWHAADMIDEANGPTP